MKRVQNLVALLFLLLLTSSSWAALPPLDDERRESMSGHIFEGKVLSVFFSKMETPPGFAKYRMAVKIEVHSASKGTLKKGQIVYAECWGLFDSPVGWAGPGGQRPTPYKGDVGKFYAQEAPNGVLELLNPNGWDRKAP